LAWSREPAPECGKGNSRSFRSYSLPLSFIPKILQLDGSSAHVHSTITRSPPFHYCFCIPRVCAAPSPRPVSPFPQGPVYLPAKEPAPTRKSIHFTPKSYHHPLSGACKFPEGPLRRQLPTLPSDVNRAILPRTGDHQPS
jgi:hypothetical protein